MKRCFVMFVALILMLLLAVLTDNSNEIITNETIVESELATDNQLMSEVISDNALKN